MTSTLAPQDGAASGAAALLAPRKPTRERVMVALRSRVAMLVIFDGVIFGAVGLRESGFATLTNVQVLVDGMALQAVAAAAMAALLAAGRFDLAIDGIAALAGILTGKMMLGWGLSVPLALTLGLLFGVGVGLFQGLAVEQFGFNPIVISLALWWITSGVAAGLVENGPPSGYPHAFDTLGETKLGGFELYDYYALVLVSVMWFILSFTKFGYHVFAAGGDRESARLKGIKVKRVGILLYIGTATTAAFVGIIFAARIDSSQPTAVDGMALNVIAAAVIGGAALAGGKASIVGTMLGLFLLNMLTNASIFLGISPLWEKAISGVVLATAVTVDAISEREPNGTRQWKRPWIRRPATLGAGEGGAGGEPLAE